MKTHIIEVTNGPKNWGKFLLGTFDNEWTRRSEISPLLRSPLLRQIGWSASHILVLDLQTGEGAVLRHGGMAKHDLDKHRVWVCPMFEPFLEWLYTQPREKVLALDLPAHVDLPDAPFAMHGYRRRGPDQK